MCDMQEKGKALQANIGSKSATKNNNSKPERIPTNSPSRHFFKKYTSAIPMDGPQASTLQNPLGLSMADKPDLAKLELDWNSLSFSVVPVCRTSTTPQWISTLFRLN